MTNKRSNPQKVTSKQASVIPNNVSVTSTPNLTTLTQPDIEIMYHMIEGIPINYEKYHKSPKLLRGHMEQLQKTINDNDIGTGVLEHGVRVVVGRFIINKFKRVPGHNIYMSPVFIGDQHQLISDIRKRLTTHSPKNRLCAHGKLITRTMGGTNIQFRGRKKLCHDVCTDMAKRRLTVPDIEPKGIKELKDVIKEPGFIPSIPTNLKHLSEEFDVGDIPIYNNQGVNSYGRAIEVPPEPVFPYTYQPPEDSGKGKGKGNTSSDSDSDDDTVSNGGEDEIIPEFEEDIEQSEPEQPKHSRPKRSTTKPISILDSDDDEVSDLYGGDGVEDREQQSDSDGDHSGTPYRGTTSLKRRERASNGRYISDNTQKRQKVEKIKAGGIRFGSPTVSGSENDRLQTIIETLLENQRQTNEIQKQANENQRKVDDHLRQVNEHLMGFLKHFCERYSEMESHLRDIKLMGSNTKAPQVSLSQKPTTTTSTSTPTTATAITSKSTTSTPTSSPSPSTTTISTIQPPPITPSKKLIAPSLLEIPYRFDDYVFDEKEDYIKNSIITDELKHMPPTTIDFEHVKDLNMTGILNHTSSNGSPCAVMCFHSNGVSVPYLTIIVRVLYSDGTEGFIYGPVERKNILPIMYDLIGSVWCCPQKEIRVNEDELKKQLLKTIKELPSVKINSNNK